jgi:hypothetical protein
VSHDKIGWSMLTLAGDNSTHEFSRKFPRCAHVHRIRVEFIATEPSAVPPTVVRFDKTMRPEAHESPSERNRHGTERVLDRSTAAYVCGDDVRIVDGRQADST